MGYRAPFTGGAASGILNANDFRTAIAMRRSEIDAENAAGVGAFYGGARAGAGGTAQVYSGSIRLNRSTFREDASSGACVKTVNRKIRSAGCKIGPA